MRFMRWRRQLYDLIAGPAAPIGWEFGAPTAGHLIGHFPHEISRPDSRRFSIRHGNELRLGEPDEKGLARHGILEVHFIDRHRLIGGFFEELLTIDVGGMVDGNGACDVV
jgi:Xaa-Pro dipeptidase